MAETWVFRALLAFHHGEAKRAKLAWLSSSSARIRYFAALNQAFSRYFKGLN